MTVPQVVDFSQETRATQEAYGLHQDETQVFWAQMVLLRGDIQAYARRSWLPEATRERADRAVRLLEQLGRYYPEV